MTRRPLQHAWEVLAALLLLFVFSGEQTFRVIDDPQFDQLLEISVQVDGETDGADPEPEIIADWRWASSHEVFTTRPNALTRAADGYARLLDGRKRYKPPRA